MAYAQSPYANGFGGGFGGGYAPQQFGAPPSFGGGPAVGEFVGPNSRDFIGPQGNQFIVPGGYQQGYGFGPPTTLPAYGGGQFYAQPYGGCYGSRAFAPQSYGYPTGQFRRQTFDAQIRGPWGGFLGVRASNDRNWSPPPYWTYR